MIEEINVAVQNYRKLANPYIQTVKAMSLDSENLYFLTPLFENGNIS